MVVASGVKQGTTWNTYICQQIVSGGDNNFDYLDKVSPMIEWLMDKGLTMEERLKRFDDLPQKRRVLKTHFPPPVLPLNPCVKYVTSVRNPYDTAVSLFHFMGAHTDEFVDFWGFPPRLPNFEVFFSEYLMKSDHYFASLNLWWPHRHDSNVLLIHYTDEKNHTKESICKINNFLGASNSEQVLTTITKNVSVTNMKENAVKFDTSFFRKDYSGNAIKVGGMIRQGKVSEGNEFPPEMLEKYKARCQGLCISPEQLKWCENGGPLP